MQEGDPRIAELAQKTAIVRGERDLLGGLTGDVVRDIEAVLAQAMVPARPAEAHRADALEAEVAMWRFYIEWSRTARTVVKERALRRALGFRDNKGGEPEAPEPTPVEVTPAVPGQEPLGP